MAEWLGLADAATTLACFDRIAEPIDSVRRDPVLKRLALREEGADALRVSAFGLGPDRK